MTMENEPVRDVVVSYFRVVSLLLSFSNFDWRSPICIAWMHGDARARTMNKIPQNRLTRRATVAVK